MSISMLSNQGDNIQCHLPMLIPGAADFIVFSSFSFHFSNVYKVETAFSEQKYLGHYALYYVFEWQRHTYFEQSNKNMAVSVFYNSLWSKKNAVL